MSSSTAAAWASPRRFALALVLCFAVTLTAAWLWGAALIEALLPVTRVVLGWIDDRFDILFLGVERNWQDTVVRLRITPATPFVLGGQVVEPQPQGWLEGTTTTGTMLQPLVVAPALAAALVSGLLKRLAAMLVAGVLALGFLLLDLPLTLFAFNWDTLVIHLAPDRFSPLLAWHQFLHAGGRLGIAVLLGLAGWRLTRGAPT